jgi:hypothetical protein
LPSGKGVSLETNEREHRNQGWQCIVGRALIQHAWVLGFNTQNPRKLPFQKMKTTKHSKEISRKK